MRRLYISVAAATALVTSLACGGLGGNDELDLEVQSELDGLEATALATSPDETARIFDLKGGGPPPMDSGNGVQVQHVAPMGDGRKALQAAVVFDRPMVGLSDLDAMSDVPLQCAPEIPHRARWAGTSTAVWIPSEGSFPLAHSFTCTVPAGVAATDGVTLENRIAWTFETERPTVRGSTPSDGSARVDPDELITVRFNHPVSLEAVRPHLGLEVDGGAAVPFELRSTDDAHSVALRADLERDTAYRVSVTPGFVGEHGPLPSIEPWSARFETYPPLDVVEYSPTEKGLHPRVGIRFEFTTPVEDGQVAKHLKITPEPEGWSPSDGSWANRHWSNWHLFEPRTSYEVVLGGDLEDQYGQKLGRDVSFRFDVGDYNPGIEAPSGFQIYAANNPTDLPFKHLNADQVNVRLAAVPLEMGLRTFRRDFSDKIDDALASAEPISVETTDDPNQWEIDTVDLKPHLATGLVAVDVTSPQVTGYKGAPVHHRSLLLVASLGVTLKVGPDGSRAWVTDLETGEPVAGADVLFALGDSVLGESKTDASGVARIDQHPGENWSRWRDPVMALARKGDERGATFHDWSDGIDPWHFDVYSTWDHDGQKVTGWGFLDRGIYKQGEPVYASVHFRTLEASGMSPPAGNVTWTLTAPSGGTIDSGEASTSDGNVSIETRIPEDGKLGDYGLRFNGDFGGGLERTVYLQAPIRAYREPAFRVSVHTDGTGLSGDALRGHVDARYMFGAPLSGGDVTWRSWAEPAVFEPEGYEAFWFGPERRWWWEDAEEDVLPAERFETTIAEGGIWELKAPEGLNRPIDLYVEAEVTDVDRQSIAGSAATRIHPTVGYVGIRPLERMPTAGEATRFEVLALTQEGSRAERMATKLEVVKRTWNRTREKGMDGRWRMVSTLEEQTVFEEQRDVGSIQTVEWTPAEPGTYVIRAVRMEGTRSQVAEDRIYVSGSGYASWGLDEDQTLRLIPDKRVYNLGDTAKILVQSPVPGLQGLVTVEREGVLWSDVVKLEGTATTVEIPIEDSWLPNVVVSVVSVEGAPPQESPDAGRPQVRVGMVDLAIDKEDARLQVAVSSDRDEYRPRDGVTVDVQVTGADGGAASGVDVVLYAVDESVLSLTDYQTPDPLTGLIHHRSLSVLTGDSRTAVMDRARFLTKGAADGGGGGESGPEIRENFVTTIAWKPGLKTDELGRLQTSFELPDNLTAFRIMAVATTADRFGSGDREILVSRPMIVRPALPRKLRVDDVAFAGVVVHNNTGETMMTEVVGTVESGPVEVLGSPVLVSVEPHTAREVPFRLKATAPGSASFVFEARSGPERDAVRWPLVVEEDIPMEVVATSGTTEGRATEKVGSPRTNRPDLGGLTIDVGTSALAGAGSGLDYLVSYPHGCVEQVSSRGMGALVAMRIQKHAGLTLDESQLREVVDVALRKLPDYRAERGGGLGYWKGARHAHPMGTAYAVEFMGRAREAGFEVDDRTLSEASAYLKDVLAGKKLDGWAVIDSLQGRAYVAVALARAGMGDAGHNNTLYDQRSNLTIASTASLMEAIARTTGAGPRTAVLQSAIESRSYIDAASASIKENESRRWARLWGSDDLATASALEAILTANDTHPLAPKFALHLASSKTSGRWANTRATAGVLAALATYADRYEQGGESRQVKASLAGVEILSRQLELPEGARAEVPLSDLTEGDLVVQSEGGRVYYEHRLAYAPAEVGARDEGFTVLREIEIVDGGGPDGEVTAGAMLAVTLRVVTPVVRHDVAVVDGIPAGWEILDSSLATTSRAPSSAPADEGGTDELPAFGGSWVYDHHEVDDIEVRLYADYMPPGIHTFRYAARATTPGNFSHPPARAEAMYEPEVFGRTSGGVLTVGRSPAVAQNP